MLLKIEKINENQIRCTLTKEDLASRQIRLSELAYGSEKARSLFQDMIAQANYEFGFEVNEVPLMVEAIPTGGDTVILVITKVEYPEELDTRFSKFSDPDEDYLETEENTEEVNAPKQRADDVLGMYEKMKNITGEVSSQVAELMNLRDKMINATEKVAQQLSPNLTKLFEFEKLAEVEALAHILDGFYQGENDLYRNPKTNHYVLLLRKSEHTPEEFNKICNITSEYAAQRNFTVAIGSYYQEHGKLIIPEQALQTLATL